MRSSFVHLASVAVIGITIVFAGTGGTRAQSVMKVCGDQWQQAKAAGTTNGETWPQFLAQCRAQQKGGSAPAPAPSTFAPAPAAPAQISGQTSAGETKTASQCNAEYATNKAAIKASGQTKRDFVAACRAGTETIPQGAVWRRRRPRQRRRQVHYSLGHSPPLQPRRPLRPRRLTAPHRRPPAQASSRPTSKRVLIARPIPSSGSTRDRASTTLPALTITGTRKRAVTCARPTPRRQVTAQP